MKKSHAAQLLLALLFGPLGLFYSSIPAAIGFTLGTVALLLIGGWPLLFYGWWIFAVVGAITVSSQNERAELEERRHQELVHAAAGGTAGSAAVSAPKASDVGPSGERVSDRADTSDWPSP